MSKKSNRHGNFRKKKGKTYMASLTPTKALTIGMQFHFESLFDDYCSDLEFNDRMDSLSCSQCRDYLAGECRGYSLAPIDIVQCIGAQMGVEMTQWQTNESQYIQ
jgi:hypothetical protein